MMASIFTLKEEFNFKVLEILLTKQMVSAFTCTAEKHNILLVQSN